MSKEKRFRTFRDNFAYYDRSGIQDYLEQKASEGWRLVKKQFANDWEFERIEPQKLHYAITYLPQYSNEDSFLLSDNKKEYLDLCAASGWQFVCAYKNMIIFLNEEENPRPLETDPEVELDSIHKSFLKHNLPKIILSLVMLVGIIIGILFSDTASNSNDFLVVCFALLSFFIVMNVCGYVRWRKKALAAAATGKFSRTDIPDKLISGLIIATVALCTVILVVKSIVTGNREVLITIITFVAASVFYEFLDKLKKKIKSNRRNRIISFIEWMIFPAAIAFVSLMQNN